MQLKFKIEPKPRLRSVTVEPANEASELGIKDSRYTVRLARTTADVVSALRLRHRVFNVELGGQPDLPDGIEFDEYDLKCRHLIVICRETGRTVGTYRLNTIETAGSGQGFYSANEFTIDNLPASILDDGIEIGRACIAREHRNSRVLFLLWKGLLRFSEALGKRYFFGCCSIFTRDERAGAAAYRHLQRGGQISRHLSVNPRRDAVNLEVDLGDLQTELPSLFEMYFRLGAEVCSPPMIDREFGTIDLFVVFDVLNLPEKFRRMFLR